MNARERKQKLRDTIKRDYVENNVSIQEAAKKYRVPDSTLRRWRKNGGWDQTKNAVREEAERIVTNEIVDRNVRTARMQKNAARIVLQSAWEVTASRAKALAEAHRANPKKTTRRVTEEFNQIATLHLRLDELALAVLGDIERSIRPTRSEFHVKIGDRISDTVTRVAERHFDEKDREVDAKGNLIH